MNTALYRRFLGLAVLFGTLSVHGDPIPAPSLIVERLFSDVLVGLDDHLLEQGWELQNPHALIAWPQGDPVEKAAALAALNREHSLIPVPCLTGKPVRLTEEQESLDFFRGVPEPPAGVPRDGSRIGFKYVFFPNAVVDSSRVPGGGGEPLVFFLVKVAPADLDEADVQPPLTREAEADQILMQRLGYDDYHQARALLQEGRFEEALPPLQAASAIGYCQAQFLLGSYEGLGESPDSQERSRAQLRLAADQGHAEASLAYGRQLALGIGGAPDLGSAREHIQRAAIQGLAAASYELARMLEQGAGGAADPVAAREQYRLAAERGHLQAQLHYANLAQEGLGGPVDLEAAAAHYRRAADQGHGLAMYTCAVMAQAGQGGPVELEVARYYFGRAAERGLIAALDAHARMLAQGEGGPVDLEAARAAFKGAAEGNHPQAQLAYALMLKQGEGGPVDLAAARDHFGRAAAQGLPQALSGLAVMLAKGEGGAVDLEAARRNALLAAVQDDVQAAQLLAELEAGA